MRTVQYQDFGKTIKGYVENSRQAAGRYYFFCIGWNVINETITVIDEGMPQIAEIQNFWGKDLFGTLQGAGGVGGLLYLTVSNSSAGHRQPSTNDYQLTTNDSSLFIPFYDANGNITRYLDESGDTVASYTYDAFGNAISQTGPMADFFHHRFSTKYSDVETDLYYYGYRFYSPELMSWLNRDPIEEAGGVNLYAMCGNNGVSNSDPRGNASFLISRSAFGFVLYAIMIA